MNRIKLMLTLLLITVFIVDAFTQSITGDLKKWHKVTLSFEGPEVSEDAEYNPFMNYRLNVSFTHEATGKEYLVPGHFAADGSAAETSATSGSVWRVHFTPDEEGVWSYDAQFRKGRWVAVSDRLNTGVSGEYMDGQSGQLEIRPTDKSGNDNRARGRLAYINEPYLQFQETGEYFLKCGSDAPENFLAYVDFDGTFHDDGHKDNLVKDWAPHVGDWNSGDPTWKGEKGKGMIGAINYLASKGMNAFSFLTNNVGGDDQNVFPYVDYDVWDRFDVSKLDQWEIVFDHADKLGMFLHFKTLEVENQGLLDNGGVGAMSKLYYRELISRFGHHLALNWNLCEESGDWVENHPTPPQFKWQRLSMAGYFHDHDPYHHHIVIHNGEKFYDLLGPESHLTGLSYQTNREDFSRVHDVVVQWRALSQEAGKNWAIAVDEPGDHRHSLIPDAEDPEHDNARKNGLWGAMMGGAWGTEWYFGYEHPHSDLSCEDFRSRDLFWDQGRHALNFFKTFEVPFWEMNSHDELIDNPADYCLASKGKEYVLYLKNGGNSRIDLEDYKGRWAIGYYNPRTGEAFKNVHSIAASGRLFIPQPPASEDEQQKDWVIHVKKK